MKIEERIVKNILGKRKGKDWDNDGINNKKDCQPYNTMRQDIITDTGLMRLQRNLNTRNYLIQKKQKIEDLKGKI